MIDQLYDRNYQVAREAMNQSIDRTLARVARKFGEVFEALSRVQFAAPWTKPSRTVRTH